ncbi:MAG: sensor histidine kinase [Leucobacter sp.]
MRRIVYALHPPALDSLGLDGAIRDQAGRLGAASVEVAELPELPDTLEIGIYLIALEAMKNTAIHARPGSFWVRLAATNGIALEVHDDGPGLAADYHPGVGIQSMRDRAAELGGTLDLLSRRPHGTLVRAEWRLPA